MLKHVKIENFRCLRNVEVDLRPLTVLIGPNDSGKTAFLLGLQRLFAPIPPAIEDFWNVNRANRIVISEQSQPHSLKYAGNEGTNKYGLSEGPKSELLKKRLAGSMFFQLPSAGVSMKSVGFADEGKPPQLDPDGGMVPALLDFILRRNRKQFEAFVEEMKKRVAGLRDVQITTPKSQTRRIDLSIEDDLIIPADRASVGVRLLLFFVALSYHPQPPPVILLEEPETGFHPRRLARVMQLLRNMTKGAHGGPPAQIILTTHSPYLLDCVDLDQDQVLVFKRQDDGSRTAEPVDAERLKEFLDDFMLGEVWYNEQEDGLVKRKDA